MLRYKVLALVMLLTFALPASALAQAVSYTIVDTAPTNLVAGGCDEPVELTGELHSVFHLTVDDSGGFHLVTETNWQGVTGVGLVSGTQYRGVGVQRFNINGNVGEEFTSVDNFKLIGRGTTDNLLVQVTLHTTVNANGEVTTVVENAFIKCQG